MCQSLAHRDDSLEKEFFSHTAVGGDGITEGETFVLAKIVIMLTEEF